MTHSLFFKNIDAMKKILCSLITLISLNTFAQVTLSVGAIEVDQPVTITVDTNRISN